MLSFACGLLYLLAPQLAQLPGATWLVAMQAQVPDGTHRRSQQHNIEACRSGDCKNSSYVNMVSLQRCIHSVQLLVLDGHPRVLSATHTWDGGDLLAAPSTHEKVLRKITRESLESLP